MWRMNPETVAAELEREPFVPLRFNLSDGRAIDIQDPGPWHIARLALCIFRVGRVHRALAEDVTVICLGHIVSIETRQALERG
jgi:hypothetical protein